MLHGSRIMDCLFESSPDYAGVTGLFPVSLTPHDDTSSAVIISFASGSRALTTGGPASKPLEVYDAGLPWHDDSLLPCSGESPLTVACTFKISSAKGVASAPALRQLPAGDTFSDVTECMCLDAEAQTLAAATLSAGCAAQVCHNLPSSGPCFAAYSMCTLLRILIALH